MQARVPAELAPPGSPTLYLPESSLQLFELRQRNPKHSVAVTPPSPYLIGAHHVDHHVLMHEHRFDLTRKHGADYGTHLNARRSLVTTES